MPVMRFLCLLFVLPTLAAAQGSPSASQRPAAKPSDLSSVAGAVVKSTTGEGIKRAAVQLIPLGGGRQPYSTLTDGNGGFTIHDVAPGRYVINATREGYVQQASGKGNAQVSILDLAPGKIIDGITLRLLPPGVITGFVYDEDGDPVILAHVRAWRVAGAAGQRQLNEAGSGETNDLGEYRIWGLQPGKYLLAAKYQPPQLNATQTADEVYLLTFHPSTADTSQANLIEVHPGAQVAGVDVDLRRAHAVTVRGRVVSDSSAKSLRGLRLSLEPRAGSYSFLSYGAAVQNDAGDFEIRDVPPGSYVVSAYFSDGKQQLYGKTPAEVGGTDLDGISLVLSGPHALTGMISVEDNSQIDWRRLAVWLQSLDNGQGGEPAQLNPDGSFVLPVYEGNYRLRAFGYPQGYYVKSARQGGREVLESGLTVSRAQPPARLEVLLSSNGARVQGAALEDEHPAAGIRVLAVPDPPRRDRVELYSMTSTDAFGRFLLSGLPPGDFKLFAWEAVPGVDYTDPDFLKSFEDRGTHLHLEEGEQQTVALEVIKAEEEIR